MFHVNTEQYSGPLGKLLELIEDKKMEVTQLSLAMVTDDFLKHLESLKKTSSDLLTSQPEDLEKQMSEEQVRLLADFLVIASKLLLIKSKSLLPSLELTQEEEEDINDLERRLQIYQQIKPAIMNIKNLYAQNNLMVSRPLFLGRQAVFYPSKEISTDSLQNSMKRLFESFKQLALEFRTIETSLIRLEEKIEEIMYKITQGINNFGHLIKEKSRKEIIVMFLALLHLLREQTVEVEQTEGFGEIGIKKLNLE